MSLTPPNLVSRPPFTCYPLFHRTPLAWICVPLFADLAPMSLLFVHRPLFHRISSCLHLCSPFLSAAPHPFAFNHHSHPLPNPTRHIADADKDASPASPAKRAKSDVDRYQGKFIFLFGFIIITTSRMTLRSAHCCSPLFL
jgi:hypothetical protein